MLLPSSSDSSGDGVGSADDVVLPETECSLDIDIQQLCNGTLASPCDCMSSQECQVCIFTIMFVPIQASVTFYCIVYTHTHTLYYIQTVTFVILYSVSRHMLVMGHCVCWILMQMDIQILLLAHVQMKTLPCTVRLTLVATHQTQTRQIFHHVFVTWQVQF